MNAQNQLSLSPEALVLLKEALIDLSYKRKGQLNKGLMRGVSGWEVLDEIEGLILYVESALEAK